MVTFDSNLFLPKLNQVRWLSQLVHKPYNYFSSQVLIAYADHENFSVCCYVSHDVFDFSTKRFEYVHNRYYLCDFQESLLDWNKLDRKSVV